jgi:hypothetical protein
MNALSERSHDGKNIYKLLIALPTIKEKDRERGEGPGSRI